MTPTPCTIAPPRPYYVRNATQHADAPGRYATHAEALAERDNLTRYNAGQMFIVKKKES